MLFLVEMIPPENKQVGELKEEIGFLNDMISNLLLTDKLDVPYSSLELEKISCLDFFNRVIGFFNHSQQEKIHLRFDLDENRSRFNIDLTKMIICIKNIVQNAFKYADTDKGVYVHVSVFENFYKISIKDFGPGISKNDKKHIFESFYRAKKSKKISGFGLGLAISKKIIEAHNGKIKLLTGDGCGCDFVLELPRG